MDIANDSNTKAASLRRFIETAHWDKKTVPMTMPEQALEADDTAGIIRYIMSLRKPK
jgi:hypothetical protein